MMTPVILIKKILHKKGRFFCDFTPPSFHLVYFSNFPRHKIMIFKETFSTPQGIKSSWFLRTHLCDELRALLL